MTKTRTGSELLLIFLLELRHGNKHGDPIKQKHQIKIMLKDIQNSDIYIYTYKYNKIHIHSIYASKIKSCTEDSYKIKENHIIRNYSFGTNIQYGRFVILPSNTGYSFSFLNNEIHQHQVLFSGKDLSIWIFLRVKKCEKQKGKRKEKD